MNKAAYSRIPAQPFERRALLDGAAVRQAPLRLLLAALAVVAIAAAYGWLPAWLHYVAKPAATLVVLWMALRATNVDVVYQRAVAVGLAASLGGDVFLMLDARWFVAGLGCFLVAHLAYLRGYVRRVGFAPRRWPFVVYACTAALLVAVLWSGLPGPLLPALIAYVAALGVMAAQAAARAAALRDRAGLAAAAGSALFVFSDACIAWDKFHTPFAAATVTILTAYWIAQALIARSVQDSRGLR